MGAAHASSPGSRGASRGGIVGLLALAAAAGVLAWMLLGDGWGSADAPSPPAGSPQAQGSVVDPVAPPPVPPTTEPPPGERRPAPPEVEVSAPAQPELAVRDTSAWFADGNVDVLVFDAEGGPVAGVEVVAWGGRRKREAARGLSDARGAVRLLVIGDYDTLVPRPRRSGPEPGEDAADDSGNDSDAGRGSIADVLGVLSAELTPANRRRIFPVVVGPRILVGGRVLGAGGAGIEGARIELVVPPSALRRVPADLEDGLPIPYATASGADGSFGFAIPAVAGAVLRVSARGHLAAIVPAPLEGSALDIRLAPALGPSQGTRTIRGMVLTPPGDAAVGAHVRLGGYATEADGAGRFTLEFRDVPLGGHLIAALGGYEPAVLPHYAAELQMIAGDPPPVTLILPGPDQVIAGRVVGTDGTPCANWQIKLMGGTPVDRGLFPPVFAEDFSAGVDIAFKDWLTESRSRNVQRTGEDGSFRIRGLRAGHFYVLRTWNEDTGQFVVSDPIEAGTDDTVLHVPSHAFRPRIFGTLTTTDGEPAAGVLVRLTMREHQSSGATSYQTAQKVETDANGAWEFLDVPRVDLILRFTGGGVKSLYYELAGDDPGQGLEVVVESNR